MNPILNQLFGQALGSNGILNMFQSVKNAQNPNAMIQSLMQQNPQMKQVMDVVNQYGGNAKQAFYAMAQQKGVDPDTIINSLKNSG